MMKPLIYKKEKNSPEVVLDKDKNIFRISGRYILENAHEFNKPIFLWFQEYFKNPNKNTELLINLDYINSSSSLFLMKMILLFEENNKNKNLKIIWEYDSADDLLKERGIELKKVSNIEFELREYTSSKTEDFDFNF